MFLARAAWPTLKRPVLQTAAKSSYLMGTRQLSFFGLPFSPDSLLTKLREEQQKPRIKELDDLAAKWLDKLDAEKKNDPSKKDIVLLPEALSEPMSERYRMLFHTAFALSASLALQLREGKQIMHGFENRIKALDLPFQLPRFTKEEIESALTFYFRLANRRVFMEELTFTDEEVAKIFKNFLELDLSSNDPAVVEEAMKKWNVPANSALNWFQTFSFWASIPCDDKPFLFPLVNSQMNYDPPQLQSSWLGKDSKTESSESWDTQPENKRSKDKQDPAMDDKLKQTLGQVSYLVSLVLMVAIFAYFYFSDGANEGEISFQQFCGEFLRKNLVSKIHVVNNKTAIVELNDNGKQLRGAHGGDYYFNIGSVESFERQLASVQDEYKIPDSLRVPVVYSTEGSVAKILINFLPTLLFLGAIYYMTKKANLGAGGPLSFGKSQAKKFNQEKDIKIRFKDVAGMSEAKQEVMEFVKFLQNPAKYEKLGAKIPRGAILSGPPGTGKTLIARATAGEAGVPFYSVSGSEFVEMFVGVGASRVRDLFKTARENAPSIVFVDEIDAIGKNRSKGNASGANDERESTLNQLLVEMDGFDSSSHVVVLAGTNRADILDKALMRPGRFDRHITIDNPELQGRIEIFDVHLKKIKVVENIDKHLSGRLAALTPGFSGADIANVCNEAALIAARYNAKAVTLRHFELAIERVIGGVEKKSKLLDPHEKRVVAYHEAGHAVCGWFLKYAHPLLKVSIIPRGQGALGYAQYLPPDQHLMSTLQLYDRMIMTLGGRVSEELNFASVTSGAHDDFKKVTQIAQSMVMRFGMSDKVGMVNYADTQSQDNLTKPFSDETNDVIDQEIRRIVQGCYDRCKQLLSEKSDAVELVAQELLKKEFITREDMIRLLGKRPFPENNDAFDKYLDGKPAYQNEKPAEEKKDDEK